ncbi:hypothetical protein AAHE18_05G249100 [Arachis hypogaea]
MMGAATEVREMSSVGFVHVSILVQEQQFGKAYLCLSLIQFPLIPISQSKPHAITYTFPLLPPSPLCPISFIHSIKLLESKACLYLFISSSFTCLFQFFSQIRL